MNGTPIRPRHRRTRSDQPALLQAVNLLSAASSNADVPAPSGSSSGSASVLGTLSLCSDASLSDKSKALITKPPRPKHKRNQSLNGLPPQHQGGMSIQNAFRRTVQRQHDLITADCVSSTAGVYQVLDRTPRRRLHRMHVSVVGSRAQRDELQSYELMTRMRDHKYLFGYRKGIGFASTSILFSTPPPSNGDSQSFSSTVDQQQQVKNVRIQMILSEYCLKGTAATLLGQTTSGLSTRTCFRMVYEILSVIAHAHAQGVAHGNLRLDNVCVAMSGTVRVKGFQNHMRRRSEYTPPELCVDEDHSDSSSSSSSGEDDTETRDGERESKRDLYKADAWAIGIILFQLLSKVMKRGDQCRFTSTPDGVIVPDIRHMLRSHPRLSLLHPSCKLLLSALLETDPNRRLCVKDALALCDRALKQIEHDRL